MSDAARTRQGGQRAGALLVVEDSRTQREVLVRDLRGAGFDVTAASSGEDALARLATAHFDLVLSDVVMEGIDGYELCRRVKEHQAHLPVILLTSLTDPMDVVRGLQAGADNFLRKPYDLDQLIARITGMLHHQRLRQDGHAQMGLELDFLDQRFLITAERQQILGLLISTFEDLVAVNGQLRERERALAEAHGALNEQLATIEGERRRLEAVLDAVPGAMVTIDTDGVITGASEVARRYLGGGDPRGGLLWDMAPLSSWERGALPVEELPLHRALATGEVIEAGGSFDLLVQRPEGPTPVLVRSAPVHDADGAITGAVGFFNEIGALAAHDPLTRLPKHQLFADRVRSALDAAREHATTAAVLVVIPDRLAQLQASLDASQGDELVALLADRLTGLLADAGAPPAASAAYLGNQEFAVLLPAVPGDATAPAFAGLLAERLRGPSPVDGLTLHLTVSIGISSAQGDGSAGELVAAASAAARSRSARGGDGWHCGPQPQRPRWGRLAAGRPRHGGFDGHLAAGGGGAAPGDRRW